MCGIAGFISGQRPEHARASVAAMVGSLAHRGPDSEGIEVWPGAVLGHRRLAILDLSAAGKQPMLSDDGEIGIVFNGCIYNFQELRGELEAKGHRFRSNCDTEVLVRGYEEWGIDRMAPRLRGMFAFGIWDNRRRKLTLVRDRLGVKPLVYVAAQGEIAFASTIPALEDTGLVGDLDPQALLEFLEFGWVTDERTIFSGARKVSAGTIIEWQDGVINERSYWDLPEAGTRRISFNEAVEQTEALFLEAARLRLISDVPVGALLSGGIDSALICWAMAKLGADIKAFTVSTPTDPADEAPAARDTARTIGIPHEIITLASNEPPAFKDLIGAYGEPFACPSALAMLRVCEAVKPKVTVLLTGDGGDDVFLGYEHHRNFHLAQRMSNYIPRPVARGWQSIHPLFMRANGPIRRASRLIDYATGGLGAVTEAHDGLPYYERAGLLGERLIGLQLSNRQIPRSVDSGRRLMSDFLGYERRTRFVAEYMTKVDGGAMWHAIEARSPFLDHVLWEFASSLPFDVRLHQGELKAILREMVRRNIGPEVANRRKQGFTVPVTRWLSTAWKPQLDMLAHDSVLESEGWIRSGSLRQAIAAASGRPNVPQQLWNLMVLEHWARKNLRRSHEPVHAFA
jgi:asparagine synthase (glutamine-hydrolysing)